MKVSEFMEKQKKIVHENQMQNLTAFGDAEERDNVLDLFSDEGEEEIEEEIKEPEVVENSDEMVASLPINIQSVNFEVQEKEVASSFEEVIREFFQCHFIDTSMYAGEELYLLWNEVYNDDVKDFDEMLQKYYDVCYGVFFLNQEVFHEAISKGVEFMSRLRFYRRAVTEADLEMYEQYGKEEWFNEQILNDFSNEMGFNPLLLEVMRRNLDISKLYPYRVDSTILLYALKLKLANKLNLALFDQAASSHSVEAYYQSCLDGSDDRFLPIKERSDFPELYNLVLNLEYAGRIIRDDVIKEFADAYYLHTILIAESEQRLNKNFAKAYLMEKLGIWEFIVFMYENDEININLNKASVIHSKILTDMIALKLNTENFTSDFIEAAKCLLLSRFAGSLSHEDYKKFLLVSSVSGGTHVLRRLNLRKRKIKSYNLFWMEELVVNFQLNMPDFLESSIGDNLVRYVSVEQKLVRTTFTLDAFVLDPEKFSEEMDGISFARVIDNDKGLILCNRDIIENTKITGNFDNDSSLTCWAKGGLDFKLQEQFLQYQPILHCSFLKTMETAVTNFKQKNGIDKEDKVSSKILDFFKIPLVEYGRYDKVFSYIQEHPIYFGLFRSHYGYELLKVLAKSVLYSNDVQVLFHFLGFALTNFFKQKVVFDTKDFATLNAHRQILLVTGLQPTECTMGQQVFIDAIDSFMIDFEKSTKITIEVKNETIHLIL